MKTIEQLAEEFSKIREPHDEMSVLGAYRQGLYEGYNEGYVQGQRDARTPIKIDPNDQNTLPTRYRAVQLYDGCQWWYGDYDEQKGKLCYYKGDHVLTDKAFTHWLPLPEVPND